MTPHASEPLPLPAPAANEVKLTEAETVEMGLIHEGWCDFECCGCICGLDKRVDATERILGARLSAHWNTLRELQAAYREAIGKPESEHQQRRMEQLATDLEAALARLSAREPDNEAGRPEPWHFPIPTESGPERERAMEQTISAQAKDNLWLTGRMYRLYANLERVGEAVKDVCWRATQYGETEDGDVFAYLVTKGAMHRLIGAAQGSGISAAFRSSSGETLPDPVSGVPTEAVRELADEWEAKYRAPIDEGPGFHARPFYGYFAGELRKLLISAGVR